MGCQSSLEASVDRRRAERYAKQRKTSELRNQREKQRDSLRRSSSFTDRSRSNSCNSSGGASKSLLTKKPSSKWFGSSGSLHRAPRRESSVVTFEGSYDEDEENSPRKRRSSSVHFIDLDGPEESYEFSPRYHDDSSPRQSFQYNFFSGGVGNTSLNKHITQRKSLVVISTANDQPKENQEELISSPWGRERQRSDSVASPRGVLPKKQLSEIDQWVLTDEYATTAEFENSLRRTASERAMNESQRRDSAERGQTAPKQLSFNSTSSAGLSTTNSVLSANQISVSGGSSVGNRSHSALSSLMRKPNTSSTNHPMDDKEAAYSGDGDLLGFITNSIPTPKGSLADQQNNNTTFLAGSRSLNNLSTSSQTSRSQTETGGVVGGGGGATAGLAVVMGSSMRSASPCDDSSLCSSSTPHFFEGIPKAILSSTKTPEILALPQTTPHQAPSSSSSLLQPPLHSLPPKQVAERILQDDDRSFVHDLETVDAAQRKQ